MTERKFSRSLAKPGSAAQARETVREAVRERTCAVSSESSAPIFAVCVEVNANECFRDINIELRVFFEDSKISCSNFWRWFIPFSQLLLSGAMIVVLDVIQVFDGIRQRGLATPQSIFRDSLLSKLIVVRLWGNLLGDTGFHAFE